MAIFQDDHETSSAVKNDTDTDYDFDLASILNFTNFTRSQPGPPEGYIYDPHKSHNSVGVLILVVLLVLLCVLLTILALHILKHRLARQLTSWRLEHQSQVSPRVDVSPEQHKKRYGVIERWLISKRALCHDDSCYLIREAEVTGALSTLQRSANENVTGIVSQDESRAEVPSNVTAEEQAIDSFTEQSCPICIGPFLVGEIVSLSTDDKCSHVYHHECIKEWLLNNSECPFCRKIMMEVDKPGRKSTTSPRQLTDRTQMSYFCVSHGLVHISPMLCRENELVNYFECKVRGVQSFIQMSDLIALRGARGVMDDCDAGNEKNFDGEESQPI